MKPTKLSIAILLLALLGAGCHHKPVYPGIGSIYITSDPSNAEVKLDGITSMRTPVMINGIPVGDHTVGLRHWGRKYWQQTVRIEPGITKRLATTLQWIQPHFVFRTPLYPGSCCMAYLPGSGRIYIGSRFGRLQAYQAQDSTVSGPIATTPVGRGQRLVAASMAVNRIYVNTVVDNAIAVLDANSLELIRTIHLPDTTVLRQLIFSPSGNTVAGIDSCGRSVWLFDTSRDTTNRVISLVGSPLCAVFSNDGNSLYLSTVNPVGLHRLDLGSGCITTTIAVTGPCPSIFLDSQEQQLAFCCSPQLQVGIVNLNNWQTNNGPTGSVGDLYRSGCFSHDNSHLWILAPKLPTGDEMQYCDSGYVSLLYLPTWQYVAHYKLGQQPWEMAQSSNGRYLYFLELYQGDLSVFITDTE